MSNYFIKLYGHLTNDPEAFSKNLAAVLGTDRETASRILECVPAVIAKAKNRQAAERLTERLAAIGATCLVESETGADSELIRIPAEPEPAEVRALEERRDKEYLRFRLWAGLLLAAVAFFCIFSLVGYVSTFSWLSGRTPSSVTAESSDKKTALDGESRAARVAEINDKIEGLKKKMDELLELKLVTKEEIRSPKGAAATDPLEMRKRKQELGVVNLQISEVNKQIKDLSRERDRIGKSSK